MLHKDVKCNDNFIANALSRVGWYCDELKYKFIAKGLYPNPFFKRGNVMNI
jgi:hypothetical protein